MTLLYGIIFVMYGVEKGSHLEARGDLNENSRLKANQSNQEKAELNMMRDFLPYANCCLEVYLSIDI